MTAQTDAPSVHPAPHDVSDVELAAVARHIAAIDAAMDTEDVSALEAAFAAENAPALPAPSDDAAFRGFMVLYDGRVRRLLGHYLRRSQDVDEGAQDVFLKMWRCWDPAQTPGHRHSLVFRVTRNTAFDRLRSRAFREYEKTIFDADDVAAVGDGSPEQHILRSERIEEVRAVLDVLPPEDRELIVAHWYAGVSFAELAASRGTTPRALITMQTRIFRKMRLRLAQACAAPVARCSELWQRLRNIFFSMPPDIAQAAIIGVMVTSLVAARPGGLALPPPDDMGHGAVPIAMEWQRPDLAPRSTPHGRGGNTQMSRAGGPTRRHALPPSPDPERPKRTIPDLPLPSPPPVVGSCDEGLDGDQITVEVQPLGLSVCRKQSIVQVCPVVPQNLPGVTCRTQGKPSYLVPLPTPTGIP